MNRIHLIVTGRVQGVGFRYFCADQAERLGLTGFARNLRDGSVEIEAQGDEAAIEEFVAAVKLGPRAAKVSGVERDDPPTREEAGFEVR